MNKDSKRVAVLLSTYNGEKFLTQLLDSLLFQFHAEVDILIRDDGSLDGSIEILRKYTSIHKNITLIQGDENIGILKSYSALLEYALSKEVFNYFLFADQDDVWKNNKVILCMDNVLEIEKSYSGPILIHTDLEVVDENLNSISRSFFKFQNIKPENSKINNLLIQNNITGCTMMINEKLARLCLPIPEKVIMHDWWIGLVASLFGKIVFVNHSTILYRQHSHNLIGAQKYGLSKMVQKFKKSIFIENYILQAQTLLEYFGENINQHNFKIIESFIKIRTKGFIYKFILIIKYKFFKSGALRNFAWIVLVCLLLKKSKE